MRKVFTVTNNFELQPYKSALEDNNIAVLIKNEFVMGVVGEIPVNESWPQIWVLEDQDETRARGICIALEKSMSHDKSDWYCHHCGEANGGNFDLCWQCGTSINEGIN